MELYLYLPCNGEREREIYTEREIGAVHVYTGSRVSFHVLGLLGL